MAKSITARAKTREQAIADALKQLGLERHEVTVEIVDEGSPGFLGFGRRDVQIKVTSDTGDDEEDFQPPAARRSESRERGESEDRGRGRSRGGRRGEGRGEERKPRGETQGEERGEGRGEERRPRGEGRGEERKPRGETQGEERGPRRGQDDRGRGRRDAEPKRPETTEPREAGADGDRPEGGSGERSEGGSRRRRGRRGGRNRGGEGRGEAGGENRRPEGSPDNRGEAGGENRRSEGRSENRGEGRRSEGRGEGRRSGGRRPEGRRDDRQDERPPRRERPDPSADTETDDLLADAKPIDQDDEVRALREREQAPRHEVTEAEINASAALLRDLIGLMEIKAEVTGALSPEGDVVLSVESPDSAILIGRKGRTLQTLQYLLNRMVHNDESHDVPDRILVDIEGYLARRRDSLIDMARRMAERARETGRRVRVKPMTAQERRIIHMALQDDTGVHTFSIGSAAARCVVIAPADETPRGGGRDQDTDDEVDDRQEDTDHEETTDALELAEDTAVESEPVPVTADAADEPDDNDNRED